MSENLLCGTAQQIVDALAGLRDPKAWETAHQLSLAALAKIDCEGQMQRLKEAMASAAASA